MRGRRKPEIIAGRVNADGSIAAGDGFTVVRSSTGSYIVTFSSGFRLIAADVTPASAGGTVVGGYALAYTERSVNMQTILGTGAGTDVGLSFIAAGVQQ